MDGRIPRNGTGLALAMLLMGLAFWTACTRSDKAANPAAKVAAAAGRPAQPSNAKRGGSTRGADGPAEASPNQQPDDQDIKGDNLPHVPSPEEILQAQKLLGAMVGAYQQAASYSDNGEVQVSGRSVVDDREEPLDSKFFFSMAFARPNKIRMQAYNGTVVGDGKTLHALIDDLPNQVLERPSPEKLSIAELFADKDLATLFRRAPRGFTVGCRSRPCCCWPTTR